MVWGAQPSCGRAVSDVVPEPGLVLIRVDHGRLQPQEEEDQVRVPGQTVWGLKLVLQLVQQRAAGLEGDVDMDRTRSAL
jgi:hypothetical protein